MVPCGQLVSRAKGHDEPPIGYEGSAKRTRPGIKSQPLFILDRNLDLFVQNSARVERKGRQMCDRYFPGTALGGRLYLDSTHEPAFCEELVVDMLIPRVGHRKARTKAKMLAVVT